MFIFADKTGCLGLQLCMERWLFIVAVVVLVVAAVVVVVLAVFGVLAVLAVVVVLAVFGVLAVLAVVVVLAVFGVLAVLAVLVVLVVLAVLIVLVVYGSWGSSALTSDLSLTNSFATSSVVRCDKILMIVQPVSSNWIRRPSESQQAQDPCKIVVN